MYKLIISPKALKVFKTMPKRYQSAIDETLQTLKESPTEGKLLSDDLAGKFSIRVGVYRVIYKINEKDQSVNIFDAGHRSKVYK